MKTFSLNRITIALSAIFLSTLIFISCQKENSIPANTADGLTDEQAATYSDESARAEASFDDADNVAFIAADEEGNAGGFGFEGRSASGVAGRPYLPRFFELRQRIGDCATITVTPNDSTYPKTVTIDFGDSCVGNDGKVRKGKMVLHFTAPVRHPGSVVTLTFVNYYVNNIHIEGTKIFRNLSEPPALIKWSIETLNGKVTFPNGRGYMYDGIKTVKQIAGMNTNTVLDDVFQITGNSKTVFNNGLTIKLRVLDPIIKKVVCPWRSEGTLGIQINNRELKLDYGFPNNGNCDNKALLTWNNGNNQRVIILP
ncbi:MAG TPA: hypothetical protein PK695_03050 [Chitinophagaceae bacterium]|nr:hypothetical protein [Chitinophagaceae bacterium]HNF38188.1 hypothetical protein [Chitinophagaceae bacterium]HNF45742.1 hypothetical protein [Chitinophagaceae bacterium]HNJ26739.1 hypothetical protein [Chitinophagaceae bacterium]HNJ56647.1 hypothetical protein [Chitinophagaceae bacterium]